MAPRRQKHATIPKQPKLTYPLRDIPRDVWKRAQLHALKEGYAVRHVLLAMLEDYANGAKVDKRTLDKYKAETERAKRRRKHVKDI